MLAAVVLDLIDLRILKNKCLVKLIRNQKGGIIDQILKNSTRESVKVGRKRGGKMSEKSESEKSTLDADDEAWKALYL